MSIRDMRIGDTIISAEGDFYEVIEKDFDSAKAKLTSGRGKKRTFKSDKLFCVDFDDGIWQETIN